MANFCVLSGGAELLFDNIKKREVLLDSSKNCE